MAAKQLYGGMPMVAFNFQPRFAAKILSGDKKHTFCMTERCKRGDAMHLYTGLHTKGAILLAEVPCIYVAAYTLNDGPNDLEHMEKFARTDGFENADDMVSFFRAMKCTFPLRGFLHGWL